MRRKADIILEEMALLASRYAPTCEAHDHPTLRSRSRNKPLRYLRITSGADGPKESVLLVGGIHGEELAPPDSLLDFARKLLDSFEVEDSLYLSPIPRSVYGYEGQEEGAVSLPAHKISFGDVKHALDRLVIYIAPLVNPDGREYAMVDPPLEVSAPGDYFDKMRSDGWRKNNPPADTELPNVCRGVNINANFPTASWDVYRYYNPTALEDKEIKAVLNPCHVGNYRGAPEVIPDAYAPEPETQFVMWLVEQNNIRFFMDIHAYGHKVAYPWSSEMNGSDPTQRYFNGDWDSRPPGGGQDHLPPASGQLGRDGRGSAYSEFFPNVPPNCLLEHHKQVARTIAESIRSAAGPEARQRSVYEDGQIPEVLYIAPGTSVDWVFSRQSADQTRAPMYAFALEIGDEFEGEMAPDPEKHYPKILREMCIAAMELLRFASDWRRPTGDRCGTCGWCPLHVATASYGSPAHPRIMWIRALRDHEVRSTPRGREFLRIVEGGYHRIAPPVARFLVRHQLARLLTRHFVVTPMYFMLRVCELAAHPISTRKLRVDVLCLLLALAAMLFVAGHATLVWLILSRILAFL